MCGERGGESSPSRALETSGRPRCAPAGCPAMSTTVPPSARGARMVTVAPELPPLPRVGRGFITRYAAAFTGTSLVLVAPLLVTLALKVNALAGPAHAAGSLALVNGAGSLVSIVANPVVGKLSDRTASPLGMRRPWMFVGLSGGCLGILVVATAS